MARHPAVDQELSAILNELWKLDVNRLKPGKDYTINLQGEASTAHPKDKASAPLFTHVDEDQLKRLPTYASFIKLLDNYEMSTDVAEKVTSEELQEDDVFLNAILQTQVMKRAHGYLASKKLASSDVAQFKKQLFDIWFKLYHRDRGGPEDSCGFEHVFVGETKHGKKIIGLHNWVRFYQQEKLKNIDYKGYITTNKEKPAATDHIVGLQFSWKGMLKPLGGSFIGVSPEFELALFTIIFLKNKAQSSSTFVIVDKYYLEIVLHRLDHAIGTSYTKLLGKTPERGGAPAAQAQI